MGHHLTLAGFFRYLCKSSKSLVDKGSEIYLIVRVGVTATFRTNKIVKEKVNTYFLSYG